MIKAGITGGIGSGKSAVCDVWEALGAYILNADELAKKVMTENPDVRKQIIDIFGAQAYRRDGSLNRTYLAKEAFDGGRVQELNAIVHPRIPAEAKKIMDQAEKDGYPLFVYEAALLLQNSTPAYLDCIVLVLADREKRLQRVLERDNTDSQSVLNRMDKQQDFNKLKNRADIIIENNGTLDELKSKAREGFRALMQTEVA